MTDQSDSTKVEDVVDCPKEEEATDEAAKITTWLTSIGMAQYIEAFIAAEVDMDTLPNLSILDLIELGVEWQQERHDILQEIAQLCFRSDAKNPKLAVKSRKQVENGKEKQNKRSGRQTRFSGTGLKRMNVSLGISRPCPGAPSYVNPPKRRRSVIDEWQLVPGTDFIVDKFKGISYLSNQHWFLTHFHSDHYGGLTKSFDKGTIYCSPVTSNLVQEKLKLSSERLQAIPLNKTVTVAGSRVTFIDANHCPGSVMIVFEGINGPPVLHTGDARLTLETYNSDTIAKLRSKGCILILDTTYCDPKYTFPPQKDIIKYVCDTVMSEIFHPRTLFVFGTYGIGKERVFLEVAKRAKRKVYVSKEKMAALECMDLPPEEKELLTTDHEATNLHAVCLYLKSPIDKIALWKVSVDSMQQILTGYGSRYSNMIGFRPTGWSYEKGMEKTKRGTRKKSGKITIYQVPYSEHSSFLELRDFVQWLDPIRIIPSVGNDKGTKLERMLSSLKQKPLTCIS